MSGQPAAGTIGDFKISLAQWSLHNALFKTKEFTNLDFPKVAREQFGIDAVEFVNQFFKDKATDAAYLKDLKTRANDNGVTCVLIMIDGEGDLSAPDKSSATWRSTTTRSGSTLPRPSAAMRSGSIPGATTAPPTSPTPPKLARPSPSMAPRTRSTSSARTTAGLRATPTPSSP